MSFNVSCSLCGSSFKSESITPSPCPKCSTKSVATDERRKQSRPKIFTCAKCGKKIYRGSNDYGDAPLCCNGRNTTLKQKEEV